MKITIDILTEMIELFVQPDMQTDAYKWILQSTRNPNWGGARKGAGAPKKITKENNQVIQVDNLEKQNNQDENLKNLKNPKINLDTEFSAGYSDFVFPHDLLILAQKFWTDETIVMIEKDFRCKEFSEKTSINKLLKQYAPNKKVIEPATDKEDRTFDIAFTTFWDKFPKTRKAEKAKSKTKFIRIIKNKEATIDEILSGVERYAKSNEVQCGYGKAPVAWLNAERWKLSYDTQQIESKDLNKLKKNITNVVTTEKWLKEV